MRPLPRSAKLVSSAVGLLVLVAAWLYVAPVELGGSTSYVVTHGTSMEPRFHAGDLVLVRKQGSYHTGEIVAYDSDVFHTIVLHRIVGVEGDRYVFKGDNNDFVDFEHPARSQLVGALWLHVPGVGAPLQSLRSPALLGVAVGLAVLLLTGFSLTRGRRRRGRERRSGDGSQPATPRLPWSAGEHLPGLLVPAGLVALPFLALAVLSFTRSSSANLPYAIPYKQSGTLSYGSAVPASTAYPEGRVRTGDPLFTHVLAQTPVRFAYEAQTTPAHSLRGTLALYAKLASTSGWQSTLALGPPTAFHGDRASVAGTLSLSALLTLMHRVQAETEVNGAYTLTIEPRVSVRGEVEATPVHASFSPQAQFSIDPLEVRPLTAATGSPEGARSSNQFAPSRSGTFSGRRSEPLFLSFKVFRLKVADARVIAAGALVLIVCLLLAGLALVRPKRREETAAIRARYGRLIVPVERVWQLPGVPVIDVTDMESLARIAEHYDRSILHERDEHGDAFWVTDESGQFRYAVGLPVPGGEPPVPGGELPAPKAEPPAPGGEPFAPLPGAGAGSSEPATREMPSLPGGQTVPAANGELAEVVVFPPALRPVAADTATEADWAAYQVANAILADADGWGAAGEQADQTLYDW